VIKNYFNKKPSHFRGNKKLRKPLNTSRMLFINLFSFSFFGQEAFMNKDFFISLYESAMPTLSPQNTAHNVVSLRQDPSSDSSDNQIHDPSAMASLISEACYRLNQISNSCKFANLSLFLAMAREEALILQKQSQA
jgi:hypothetical protein